MGESAQEHLIHMAWDRGTESQEKSTHIDSTFAKHSPGSVQRHPTVLPGSLISLTLTTQDYSL